MTATAHEPRFVACGFCGRAFLPDQGQPVCRRCPLAGHCQLVRCPHCGYENPVEPRWLGRWRRWASAQ